MKYVVILICFLWPVTVVAEDFTVSAPDAIVESGFLQHLLPRFALKHGVRVTVVDAGGDTGADTGADVVIGDTGVPVFAGLDRVWHVAHRGGAGPALFTDWLLSDIGKRTIAGFKRGDDAPFTADIAVAPAVVAVTFDGDPVAGEAVSLSACGRCHVVNDSNRMNGMDQAPSFAVMRGFDDWQNRFAIFYVLNPHPSFTQVTDITPPFPDNLPPAIVPVTVTQDDLEAILAFVATLAPADLGAPLHNQ